MAIETQLMDIFDQLVTKENLGAAAGIYAVLTAVRKAVPNLYTHKVFNRLLPFLPLILGIGSAFLVRQPGMKSGSTVVLGLVIGFTASQFHQILSRVLSKKTDDISTPQDESAEAPKAEIKKD